MRGKWVLIDVNWSLKIKFKLETWLKTCRQVIILISSG